MNTIETNSLFNPALKAAHNHGKSEQVYKGYTLDIDLHRLGIGGNVWIIVVKNKYNEVLGSFDDDAFCVAEESAKVFIDSISQVA